MISDTSLNESGIGKILVLKYWFTQIVIVFDRPKASYPLKHNRDTLTETEH